MKEIALCIISVLISIQSFAANIEKLDVNVKEEDGVYISSTNAILVGNYDTYVNRMLNVNNYAALGVPYIVKGKKISPTLSWVNSRVLFMDDKYYVRTNDHRGAKETTSQYFLIHYNGPLPQDNHFEMLTSNTVVKVISGKGDNTRFSVNSISRVKLKPGSLSLGLTGILHRSAKGSVEAFAQ